MTEEIIYNKCCCYENGFCLWVKKYYETGVTPKCEQVKDCYYKQLKRLEFELKVTKADYEASEQENKELKEKYTHVLELAKTNADSNEYCLQELEQENKALKDNNNHLQAIIDDGRAENKRFREENKELKEENSLLSYNLHIKEEEAEHYLKEVSRHRSALEEVRILATKNVSIENFVKIQNKINEVLNEKNK